MTYGRIGFYNITVEQVYQTLSEPEQLVPSIKDPYYAYRRTGDWILRVILLGRRNSLRCGKGNTLETILGGNHENRVF